MRRWIAAVLVSLALAPAAWGQAKPARLVVAFPPGGPTDFVARLLADQLTRLLGAPVLVENRPGANGNIAAEYVAKSPADGSVLFFTSVGAVSISPALYASVPYDPIKDFAPVSRVVNNTTVFVTGAANPANDAKAFVAATLKEAQPTAIGSSGSGSIPHLTLELFRAASGAKVFHVPYKGAAPVISDVIAGRVAGFFGDLPGVIGQLHGGKLKALGVASANRAAVLPNVPTLAEQGIAGVYSNNWYAVLAPARTPADVVSKLNSAIRDALADRNARERLIASGAEPAPSTPDELAALIKEDGAKWAKIIRDNAIRGD